MLIQIFLYEEAVGAFFASFENDPPPRVLLSLQQSMSVIMEACIVEGKGSLKIQLGIAIQWSGALRQKEVGYSVGDLERMMEYPKAAEISGMSNPPVFNSDICNPV